MKTAGAMGSEGQRSLPCFCLKAEIVLAWIKGQSVRPGVPLHPYVHCGTLNWPNTARTPDEERK